MTRGHAWTDAERTHLRAEIAAGRSAREIGAAMNMTRKAVLQAARRFNLGPWRTKPGVDGGVSDRVPDDFAELWVAMSQRQLAAHYGRSNETIAAWIKRAGLFRPRCVHITKRAAPAPASVSPKPVAPRGRPHSVKTVQPIDRHQRDMSAVGQAVDFLRKFGAVYRCNPRGGADMAGTHWRRGIAVLTDAELIERAEDKGWVAERWAA